MGFINRTAAEAESAHLTQHLERQGLTPLNELAEKRERLLDEALTEQQRLLDQHGADAKRLGRTEVARKIASAKCLLGDARLHLAIEREES